MILGTAGHIDHGKTALVRALTGVDTDRLPEEKRRGITIELGYAPLHIDDVGTIGIVDVPGHEAFVRTMLAGATGIDLALVVIAADEGVMPQTREHLAILELLGVKAGVVALTKCDAADAEWINLVEADVRDLLAAGPLAGATLVRCSSRTGAGIDQVRAAIGDAAARLPARASDDLFRMPIDRVFTVKGTGTVVTGTVWSGSIAADDTVVVAPAGPTARVRSIESHGEPRATARSGARAAIALAGVDRATISARGATLVRAGDPWIASTLVRADIVLLDGARSIGPRTRVRLHLGTAEVGARVVAVGGPVAPGRRTPVRLSLDAPVVARAGDRFVIRDASPSATIGGGIVTDPSPPRRRTKPFPNPDASAPERLRLILREAGGQGVVAATVPVRVGTDAADVGAIADAAGAVRAGGWYFDPATVGAADAAARAALDAYHAARPLEPAMPVQALRLALHVGDVLADHILGNLTASGTVTQSAAGVARRGWHAGATGGDTAKITRVADALRDAGSQPPSVGELAARLGPDTLSILKLLVVRGDAVAVASDRYFAADALAALERTVRAALAGGAARSASELREATGLTRKYIIPILEYFDRTGVTVRRGDSRQLAPPR